MGEDDEGAHWLIMRDEGDQPGVFNLMERGGSITVKIVRWYPLPDDE